jgi:hypothetical protein
VRLRPELLAWRELAVFLKKNVDVGHDVCYVVLIERYPVLHGTRQSATFRLHANGSGTGASD